MMLLAGEFVSGKVSIVDADGIGRAVAVRKAVTGSTHLGCRQQ